MQRRQRTEFGSAPPSRLTSARLHDKFEADATVQNVNKGRSGKPRTSTDDESVRTVLQAYEQSPRKSVRQCSSKNGVCKTTVHCILRNVKWKPYILRLLHAMNQDDPDRRIEFREWFLNICNENESFPDLIIWCDEATFNLIGTVNRHNCVYWAQENPHVTEEGAVNLPGISVLCGLSSRGVIGPFFFEATVTGTPT